MAPMDLPTVDLSSMQKADILQTYWLLFEHMMKDFVHKDDLRIMLNTNMLVGVASPPDYILKGQAQFPSSESIAGASAKNAEYKLLIATGGAIKQAQTEAVSALVK